jgi:hypothetical protein
MKGYKGFNSKLQCTPNGKAFQYEVGKTATVDGTVALCNHGLHFCEHPLDTWNYYGPLNGSRYAEVEAEGVSDKTDGDSKRVAQSITVKAEVKIPALLKAAVEFVFKKVKATTGYYAHSATTGYYAHSATTGDYAHSATTGNSAHSATTGDSAHSATTGNSAHSATTGYYAHSATTGDSAHSATTGDSAHSATTGDSAHSATTGNSAQASALGKQSIAASFGCEGKAKGALGNWIVLAEWGDGKIKHMGLARVDGKKIKADTFYVLKGGKFTEDSNA